MANQVLSSDVIESLGSDPAENVFFLPIWTTGIMFTNLDENRFYHKFYRDLRDLLASKMSKDLFRTKCLLKFVFINDPFQCFAFCPRNDHVHDKECDRSCAREENDSTHEIDRYHARV